MDDIATTETAGEIALSRQLITCALMCCVAVIIIVIFQPRPYIASLLAGLGLAEQILLGLGVGVSYASAAFIGYRFTAHHKSTQKTARSYGRLDLSGWNPVWISLAAGFGEELLFRGALQPLIGIWLTSILFVVAHVRAYRFRSLDKTVAIQAFGIFATSVILGLIALYAGLATAMIVHASVDTAGLLLIRRASLAQRIRTA